mmetsp:Transcript_9172/g.19845  ORF Transcript_9172/g.19845 Transcript_9172/m.19845 type:complete len:82 (+) Transcript_9172:212-457(+)
MHSLLLLAALARFPMIDLLKASNDVLLTESGIMLQKSLTHEARSLLIEHYWVAAIDIQSNDLNSEETLPDTIPLTSAYPLK